MAEPIIHLEHVSRTYHVGDVDVHALRDVSLTIEAGEFVAIMGASGSGKSTLMNVIGCLDRPADGRYFFEGLDVARFSEPERARLRFSDVSLTMSGARADACVNLKKDDAIYTGTASGHASSHNQLRLIATAALRAVENTGGEDGAMVVAPKTGYIRTKQSFGDIQLHLEFRTPSVVKGTSQGRGNSGVFFMGLYEVQVLDSFNNKTYVNGQVGAVYKQHVPLVNASRGPGEWQTYDIVFLAPTFLANGVVDRPARVTVFHNGVIVQHDVEIKGETAHRGYPFYHPHAAKLPLQLQDHGDLVAYRNIWVRELSIPGR